MAVHCKHHVDLKFRQSPEKLKNSLFAFHQNEWSVSPEMYIIITLGHQHQNYYPSKKFVLWNECFKKIFF